MQKMLLKILAIFSAIMLIILSWLFFNQENQVINSKLQISVSSYPLYFFAKNITGDQATIINLSKAGTDPHDYEPSSGDLKQIANSKLLIVNGNKFETWLNKFGELISQENTTIIKVAPESDPHTWLDPNLAIKQVELINAKLQELDPVNATIYQNNANQLLNKLIELDQDFQKTLQKCQNTQVISTHNALGYLAARYHFQQITIEDQNSHGDLSPTTLARIIETAKQNKIQTVLSEPLENQKAAATIAEEIDGEVLAFDPIENLAPDKIQRNADYFSLQKENLATLQKALNCQAQ